MEFRDKTGRRPMLTAPQPKRPEPICSRRDLKHSDRPLLWALAAVLVLFGIALLHMAQGKLLTYDELLSFYTANVPTLADLWKVQASTPVSLDPPAYHLFSHLLRQSHLDPAVVIRLPSLGGFLLMAVCIFLFTRRIAGTAAAVCTVGILVILQTSTYAIEARPYGMLLGLSALSLLLWQNAKRNLHRQASLAGLFLALGLAIASHYFAILLGLPLLAGELYETLRRRSPDRGALAAIFGAYLFILTWLPFLEAASLYKAHYYTDASVWHVLTAYTWLVPCPTASQSTCHVFKASILSLLLVLSAIAIAPGLANNVRKQQTNPEWIAILVLIFLPFAGVALALATSGAFEPRFVVEFAIGLAVAAGCGLASLAPSAKLKAALSAVILAAAALRLASVFGEENAEQARMSALFAVIAPSAQGPVYSSSASLVLYFYGENSSPPVPIIGVYDYAREMAFDGTTDLARASAYLHHFASLREIPYDHLPHGQFEMLCALPSDWICDRLRLDGDSLTLQASAGDFVLYSATSAPSRSNPAPAPARLSAAPPDAAPAPRSQTVEGPHPAP